jgi:glycosyltransferase involved in cell wall biosynthesis
MGGDDVTEYPRVGIVIPVFGHSRLVAEAIASALGQDYPGDIDIIVVIDGDRDEETLQTVASFLAPPGRSIAAVYRPNGRLPAARNTGIRYLLQRFDDLFAIYFLDADNRLTNLSIASFAEALHREKKAAWAYPDVTFFGLNWGYSGFDIRETAPTYSRFRHLMGNICEAGSMVRADIFRNGIFFDESFTHGYEDWEFWLQCLQKGYFGTRVDNAGFLYRRRADSMLADADRVSSDIRRSIGEKHRGLYVKPALWEMFAEEFRPLLFVSVDGAMTTFSTSPHSVAMRESELRHLIIKAYRNYHHTYLPRFLIYPLSPTVEAPTVDLPLLKQIMELQASDHTPYIDQYGLLSTNRSDSSAYGLTRFTDILLGRDCPRELLCLPAYFAIRKAVTEAHSQPGLTHASRRYSGPPSYRIDDFLLESESMEPAPAVLGVSPRRRCLVVHGMAGTGSDRFFDKLRETYQVTALNLDHLSGSNSAISHVTAYNGARMKYREDDVPFKFIGEIASGFDVLYVMDDFSYLFHAGQWKKTAKEIILWVTESLTADQRIALQGCEHSLTKVVCPEREMIELAALGIPARKLQANGRHLAILDTIAKTPPVSLPNR